jgi:DNA-binding NarL/FixJ family response regulator
MTRIVLYTSEPTAALGFRSLLDGNGLLYLAGISTDTSNLITMVENEKADVLLLDMTPDVNFQLLRDLKKSSPGCKVLLWVNSVSMEVVFQFMGLGLRGVVRKTLSRETLVTCLKKVSQGEFWFEKSLTDHMLSSRKVSLTPREGQLVTLLSQGLKNKAIATVLCISENTVKVYLSRLFVKVGVKDRFELALHGLRNVAAGHERMDRPAKSGGENPPVLGLRSLVLDGVSGWR